MQHDNVKRAVIAHLIAAGWTYIERPHFTAIASLSFETATVPQNAVLYWSQTSESSSLLGQYFSEGRNVLEAGREIFGSDDSPDMIAQRVDRFLQFAMRAIDGSYARGLHLRWPKDRAAA